LDKSDILDRVRAYKQNFLVYNRLKLNQLHESLERQVIMDLLEFIPFLLHVNIPDLPGYIQSAVMPVGISGYSLAGRTPKMAVSRTITPGMMKHVSEPFVHMLALMGSSGTIAFNSRSDFDFWVCGYESEYSPEAISQFKAKCRKIEDWIAETYSLEVHFFLNDIVRVQKNIFDRDEHEGLAGSSLGQLLKEEFFRSSILIAGKIPFWWVTPPDVSDVEYQAWYLAVRDSDMGPEFVDIGNLGKIIVEDFLIAALFQILKSLGNPFKSIIKLGLLERYMHDVEGNPYISNLIKKNVQSGKMEPEDIDAYLIMFNQVHDYFARELKDDASLDLVKNSFYLKVDPRLSQAVKPLPRGRQEQPESLKRRKMKEYTARWQWTPSMIGKMDEFDSWDIDSVHSMMNSSKKYILQGYKSILNSMGELSKTKNLSPQAIKGITHKIYSHFAIEPTKIDNTLSFKTYPAEKLLTIEFIKDRDGKEYWLLQKRLIVHKSATKLIMHKDASLFGLVVWISLNGLFQKDYTRLEIATGLHEVDPNFIRELITELSVHFSFKKVELENSYFLRDPFPVMSYMIINPYSRYAKRLEEIIFLYHSSWGETRFDVYRSELDLAQIAVRVINGGLMTGRDYRHAISLIASQPFGSSKEFHRIREFCRDIYEFFVTEEDDARKRYITMLGNSFFIFSSRKKGTDNIIVSTLLENELRLLYNLSYNRGNKTLLRFDPSVPELEYLKAITENHKDDVIQVYFQIASKYSYFFVSDEKGAITFYRKDAAKMMEYLAHLHDFAYSAAETILANNRNSTLAGGEGKGGEIVELYRLEREAGRQTQIKKIDPAAFSRLQETKKAMKPFHLSLHLMEDGDFGYRFTLPDGGFSEIYHKNEMDALARELKVLLQSVPGYTFYVSGINLEHAGLKLYKMFTSISFAEKNRFELLVEKGMRTVR